MSVECGRGPGQISADASRGMVEIAIDSKATGLRLLASLSPADALDFAEEIVAAAGAAAATSS